MDYTKKFPCGECGKIVRSNEKHTYQDCLVEEETKRIMEKNYCKSVGRVCEGIKIEKQFRVDTHELREGKHQYVKEERLYLFYKNFKQEIKENILAEFEDNTKQLCVSIRKKKLYELINKLNPRGEC